jgi:glyoxylase-like metal-dependent hydrolase (beta-lactamase superfamily II)
MAKYRVTVQFSGTCEYEFELSNVNAKDDIRRIFDTHGSFDHVTNRVNDRVNENILIIEKVEE